jgi:hypothetical protein
MTHTELYERLADIAPHVAFSASLEPDIDNVWDGDGPDPENEGMEAVEVRVSAQAIVNGWLYEGEAHLCGHYVYPGDLPDDISGYLPQKLEEAAKELLEQVEDPIIRDELTKALAMIDQEMTDRYNAQMAERRP